MPRELTDKSALYDKLKHGTTTVGVVCRDGVVLATDRRATAGTYVAHKRAKKMFILDDNKAATIAGLVADAQMIMDSLKSQIYLMKMDAKGPVSTKSVATYVSNVLFSSRGYPYIVQFIIAGYDDSGPSIYVLDWFGTLTQERFITTGSGSPYAIGVLEASLKREPTLDDALPVVARAVRSSIERDPGSGEGIDMLTISKEGLRELTDAEISGLLAR